MEQNAFTPNPEAPRPYFPLPEKLDILPAEAGLPDLFRFLDPSLGTVDSPEKWEPRRQELKELLQYYLYGSRMDPLKTDTTVTAVRENYRDTVIVLSRGYYSALPPAEAGFPEEEWVALSYTIRKYHELAHFFSQRLYPANKDAVRDEVLADMNGIIAALGHFDAPLERKLLGIRDGAYTHGRLENYVEPEALSAAVERVNAMLDALEQSCTGPQEPFAYLRKLEEEKTFLG